MCTGKVTITIVYSITLMLFVSYSENVTAKWVYGYRSIRFYRHVFAVLITNKHFTVKYMAYKVCVIVTGILGLDIDKHLQSSIYIAYKLCFRVVNKLLYGS